jgi:hypothetical protein
VKGYGESFKEKGKSKKAKERILSSKEEGS